MTKKKYDEERDILYISEGESVESVPRGGFIVQLDSNREVVGVEVLEASEVISDLTDLTSEQALEVLQNIEDVEKKVSFSGGIQLVGIVIKSSLEGEQIRQTVNLEAPAAAA